MKRSITLDTINATVRKPRHAGDFAVYLSTVGVLTKKDSSGVETPVITQTGINSSNTAYINALTGNDLTAVIGRPESPYATIAAALLAGALQFKLARGAYAGFTITATGNYSFSGEGLNNTSINASTITVVGGVVTIQDVGHQSINFIGISNTAPAGANGGVDQVGAVGGASASVNLFGLYIGANYLNTAGTGGAGGITSVNTGNNGGAGGTPGGIVMRDCIIAGLFTVKGATGGAGTGVTSVGGNGGPAATWDLQRCRITGAIDSSGGTAGVGGTADGNGGDASQNVVGQYNVFESGIDDRGGTGTAAGSDIDVLGGMFSFNTINGGFQTSATPAGAFANVINSGFVP